MAGLVAACTPDLPIPAGAATVGQLEVRPAPVKGAASRAVSIVAADDEVPRLFQRKLSSGQVANIRRGEVSETLLSDEVELTRLTLGGAAWDAGGGLPAENENTWVPKRLLAPSTEHSLLTSTRSLDFVTLPDELVAVRVWPAEPVSGAALFCLESSRQRGPFGSPDSFAEPAPILFAGSADGATAPLSAGEGWTQLDHSPSCWFIELEGPNAKELSNGPVEVQPTWLAPGGQARPPGPNCAEKEQALEWGCLTILDDRVLVRGGDAPTFWAVSGDARAWFVLEPGRTGVVRGLSPLHGQRLEFVVHFSDSERLAQVASFETLAARPHLVINEVLSDPVGSEPAQEWVEVYNDDSGVVDLDGWSLEDEAGRVVLPSVTIAPMGYVLLVNDTYVPNSIGEPAPEPNVLLVRLPTLAKSGLSNSGETLRLVDKSDMLVSSFPGTPKPTPGVSIARVAPWVVDGDRDALGFHGAPGASPGAANEVRPEAPGD